ncbi:MAG: exodeoxyribonuclease 7 large subunit [Phycisphaerae bacterium]|nr:MAG: exodeoxyribonuclease 7 large subunit [Phycisphaerae bacterium]
MTQLCARVTAALNAGFPTSVRVVGEISGFSSRTHWYYALKDADSVINCVTWASAARKLGFTPSPGTQVVATGKIDFYAPAGRVTLIADKLEPVGLGARDLALKKLVEEARALGWLAPERKRPLPLFPRRIAVVTSETGAALRDVIATMFKRCPAVGLLTLDVRVQGDRAAPEVAQALRYLSTHARTLGIDAVLLTRGGGSAEDLWAFNERIVAQAIVECSVPVVAAIGHETDTCLAELVADERAATPTQAAMRLAPDASALRRHVLSTESRLDLALSRHAKAERQRLAHAARSLQAGARAAVARGRSRVDSLASRLARRSPAAVHARTVARLDAAIATLSQAVRDVLARRRPEPHVESLARAVADRLRTASTRQDSLLRHLRAVNPLAVLDRGYSVTMRADGRVVRSPNDVGPGEALQSRVAEGVVRSVVWDTAPPPPKPDRPTPAPPHPRKKPPVNPGGQGGLFERT